MAHKISNLALLILAAHPCAAGTAEYFSDSLANVVRLYRGEAPEFDEGSKAMLVEQFPTIAYADVAGLCRAATSDDIAAQGWSFNPGRYVGVGEREVEDVDYLTKLEALAEEFEALGLESREHERAVAENLALLMGSASGS